MSKLKTNTLESLDGTVSVDVKDLGIIKSPDGSSWIIKVADNGTLTAEKK